MTRTVTSSDFGTLFSTLASLASPLQGGRRPLYEAVPQLAVRRAGPGRFTRTIDALLAWSERARQRRQLMGFDDHLLRDIGISRAEADAEAAKPFWQA